MTRAYTPDAWVPILIESKEHGKIYKVLAGWYGGYLHGDSWKLSSGIESITANEDGTFTMPQSSGSVYHVGPNTQVSSLMFGVFSNFSQEAEDSNGEFSIKMIEVPELLEAFKA